MPIRIPPCSDPADPAMSTFSPTTYSVSLLAGNFSALDPYLLWGITYRLYCFKLLRFCHISLKKVSFFKAHHSSLSHEIHFVHSLTQSPLIFMCFLYLWKPYWLFQATVLLFCKYPFHCTNALVEVKELIFDASFYYFLWPSVALIESPYSWCER